MKNQELADHLLAMGFVYGNPDKDLGTKVTGLLYLTRQFGKQFQYVSLCSYNGEFLEAVFHVYDKVFNSKNKNQHPLFCTLYRNLPELEEAVNKEYKKIDPPKKT